MTAFNEILIAEQEAEQAILSAKEEAAKVTLAAKAEAKARLAAETKKLEDLEVASIQNQEKHIAGLVEKIHSTVKSRVDSVKMQFASHKAELKATLTKNI